MNQEGPLTEEQRLYRSLAVKENASLGAVIEAIERGILERMKREGYGENQLSAALSASRITLLTKELDRDYLQRVFPEDADPADNLELPLAAARFNELYEGEIAAVKPELAASDAKILAAMQERMPLESVREAYLGSSLYRALVGNDRTAQPEEQRVWKSYREAREKEAARDAQKTEDIFAACWQQRSRSQALPLAYREGRAAVEYLRETGVSEDALRALLEKYAEYEGRDRDAYLRKLAREAYEEKLAYDALQGNEEDAFAAALKLFVRERDGKPVSFADEKLIADALREAQAEETSLRASLLSGSPALHTPGFDHGAALAALLGQAEGMPFQRGSYLTSEDRYKDFISSCEEALIEQGAGRSVAEDRACYNKLAARELLEAGATEEEIKDILLRIGGIPARERAKRNLDKLLAEAREAKERGEAPEPPVAVAEESKNVRKEEKKRVRAIWKEEPADIPQSEEALEQSESQAPVVISARERRRELARIPLFSPKSERKDATPADEFYDSCKQEYKEEFLIPFNDQMDEGIILCMLNQGYEEKEIVAAMDRLSEAASRAHQSNYAANKMKNVKKNPKYQNLLKGFEQKLVNAERNYLQTKYREGKEMTSYDEALVRRRDPCGVPQ